MERKYSIVLTVYNAELYLGQCLESIKSQTYENWELILVNDGSTDGSGKMSQKFAELINTGESLGSVLYLKHENMGAVFSRERGIAHATGDYVLFIDADDYWDNNLIGKVDEAVRETGADIIQFGYKFVDEVGKETTDCGLTQKGGNGNNSLIVDKDNNSFSYKALTICYSLWSRAFNRSLFDTEEGFYRDYYDVNMTNDLLAFSRPLSLAKSYCSTDFYPYNYRILESSLCHDVSIKKICSYFKSIGWAEKCLRTRNGMTNEHADFFSKRLVNIVFDEYREKIYSSRIQDIKRIYESLDYVEGLSEYLEKAYKNEEDWYKRIFLKSYVKKWVVIPKLLVAYTKIKDMK